MALEKTWIDFSLLCLIIRYLDENSNICNATIFDSQSALGQATLP